MKEMLKDQNTYSFVAEMRDEYGNVRVKRFKVFYISRELGRICIVRTDVTDIVRGEQRQKEELAAAAVMLAVWWGFLALCAAGVLPHMEPDRYSWLLAGAVTILFGAELLLWPRGRRDR